MITQFNSDMLCECAGLYAEVFNCEPWNENWTCSQAESYLSEFVHSARFIGFVSVEAGKINGAAFCREKTWQNGSELFIDELYVSSNCQGKGIGSEIMSFIEKYAKEHLMTSVTLLTKSDKPAMIFYKARGYASADEFKFMYKNL